MSFKFEKLSVLIVEDIKPMQQLFATVLQNLGIKNVQTASDGESAFRLFKKENHDIILTDWVMTPEDGIELTKKVRKSTESPNRMVPIILITGYSAISRVEKARDAGVTEFLVKPFTANDIAKRLAHVITKPRNFIETEDFFGPDRRRRKDPHYDGPLRRKSDEKKYSATGD
jgi:CheY-like chemotaxis protein